MVFIALVAGVWLVISNQSNSDFTESVVVIPAPDVLEVNLAVVLDDTTKMSYKERQYYLQQVPHDLNQLSCDRLELHLRDLGWQSLAGVTPSAAYAIYDELLTLYRCQKNVSVDAMLETLLLLAGDESHDFTTRDYAMQHFIYFEQQDKERKVEAYKVFETQEQRDRVYQFLVDLGKQEVDSMLSGVVLNSLSRLSDPLAVPLAVPLVGDAVFPYEAYDELLTLLLSSADADSRSFVTACQFLAQKEVDVIQGKLSNPEIAGNIKQRLNALTKSAKAPSLIQSLAMINLLKCSQDKQWLAELDILAKNPKLPVMAKNLIYQ